MSDNDTEVLVEESELDILKRELEEIKDKWLRAEAEVINVRNRAKKDVDEARQYAIQRLAVDVIETAENLKRGLSNIPSSDDEDIIKLYDGFASIERNLLASLARHGIKGDHPVGAQFDANYHQAVSEIESEEYSSGTIIEAWTNTWTLNGRLLTPAMVVVAKS
jgi:molecular chaperone GrpE